MTVNLKEPSASLILLDIEGTTTPIDFVYNTLFPFARARVKDYLSGAWDALEIQTDLAQLRAERSADVSQGLNPPALECESSAEGLEATVAYIHWLMDRDRKSTPLKSIQGRIWREAYQAGELLGQAFEDVPPALARGRQQNKLICIHSSGSAPEQTLPFAHTTIGHLRDYICR